MNDRRSLLEREMDRVELRPFPLDRFYRRRDRKRRNQQIAAIVVAIAIFAAPLWIFATGGPYDRSQTPAASVAAASDRVVIGLPPEGATPSALEQTRLVLNLGGWSTIWVYADGRMISTDDRPADANGASSGLVEQRLTPDGVEFLRSAVISTGMFDEDLALAVGPGSRPTFLSVLVRNGDRLVNVTWAVRKNFLVGPDAPIATPEQASTLEGLYGLFTDPTSWPANAWEDREIRGYVPSTYSICFRAYPTPIEPVRAWGLLPRAAQDLLSAGDQVSEQEVASNGNCSRVTTDDARALAEISNAAGIDIFDPPNGFPEVLQYRLYDPSAPLDEIDMNFAPILPDGHATWLGPG